MSKDTIVTTGDKGLAPLYLYVPTRRIIILSILSMGVYEAYWVFKNWRYIKEREKLDIKPFWRAFFGIFFCHKLFRHIHADQEVRAFKAPPFAPNRQATGWVCVIIFSKLVSYVPKIGILAPFIPSFLFLVPVQKYINEVTEKRNPEQEMYPLSSKGHVICIVFGAIMWSLSLFGLFAKW